MRLYSHCRGQSFPGLRFTALFIVRAAQRSVSSSNQICIQYQLEIKSEGADCGLYLCSWKIVFWKNLLVHLIVRVGYEIQNNACSWV